MRVVDPSADLDSPATDTSDQRPFDHDNRRDPPLITRRMAMAAGASTLLLPSACGQLPPPEPVPAPAPRQGLSSSQVHVFLDFTNPIGMEPQLPIDWRPGDDVDLSKFYPGQPGMNALRFARSSDVGYSDIYLDQGLILEMRARSPNQSFGVFVPRPSPPWEVYSLEVRVWFDIFRTRRSWIAPNLALLRYPSFIGSVAAIGTQADVTAGQTSDGKSDKNIGATCVFNYDPFAGEIDGVDGSLERIRLNGPQYEPKIHGTFQPFEFSTETLVHPISDGFYFVPIIGDNKKFTYYARWPLCLSFKAYAYANGSNATSVLFLSQSRPDGTVVDGCGPGISPYYTSNFAGLGWAGAAIAITDPTVPPFDLGPAMVRISYLEVIFDTQPSD